MGVEGGDVADRALPLKEHQGGIIEVQDAARCLGRIDDLFEQLGNGIVNERHHARFEPCMDLITNASEVRRSWLTLRCSWAQN